MSDKTLRDLLAELKAQLQNDTIAKSDRAELQQLHSNIEAALRESAKSAKPGLQSEVQRAVERLERDHPKLTSLLSRVLDALSDVGV